MPILTALFRAISYLFLAAAASLGNSAQTQAPPISITVLCDSVPFQKGLSAGQGFACLIQGTEKTVLFDTGGGDPARLFRNFAALKIDPQSVDLVVVSRDDPDATGGLLPFLAKKSPIQVFLPASVPAALIEKVKAAGGVVEPVKDPVSVCEGVFSTGDMASEQALVVVTPKGLIILAGCGQSEIIRVVEKAGGVMPKPVYLLMGGLRLADQGAEGAAVFARRLRELGVKCVGPASCSGPKTVGLLKKEFGVDFVPMGAGKAIEIR